MSIDEIRDDNEKHKTDIESLILQAILESVRTSNVLEINYWFEKYSMLKQDGIL